MLFVEWLAGHSSPSLSLFAEAPLSLFCRLLSGIDPPLASLAGEHRSEAPPDHALGTIHHLIYDVGDAHQSLGLPNRFPRQQAHLLKIARELRRRWKSAKPLHGNLLSKKPRLANDRKLGFRNHPVWRRAGAPFPLPHPAAGQPAG